MNRSPKNNRKANSNSLKSANSSNAKSERAGENMETSANSGKWKRILRWVVQILVIGLIAFFLFRNLARNWHNVLAYNWRFNPWILAASFLLLCATLLFMVFLWRGLLRILGARVSFSSAVRIFSVSSLGRYLPGKVWQVVGMVYLSKKEGVRTEAGVWAALLAQMLAVLAGFGLSMVVLFLEQERVLAPLLKQIGWQHVSLWWMLIPLAVILIALHPRILEKLTNWMLKLLKREPIRFRLSYAGLLGFFLLYVLSWVLYGVAFFMFINSLTPLALTNLTAVTGIFTVAYIVGLLAIFVPGGLGVREGLLVMLLEGILLAGQSSVATPIALAQRLWFTAAELTFVLISLIFLRRKNGRKKTN